MFGFIFCSMVCWCKPEVEPASRRLNVTYHTCLALAASHKRNRVDRCIMTVAIVKDTWIVTSGCVSLHQLLNQKNITVIELVDWSKRTANLLKC